jgi:CRISPR-associated endonuclease Csn1
LVANQTVGPVPSALYKGYAPDSYVCCDIWRVPKGKPGKWRIGEFEWRGAYWAYSETIGGLPDKAAKKPHPAASFIMRVFKNDMVSYEEAGMTRIMRVAGFSTTNNKLDLKPHHATDPSGQYISINVLGPAGLRKLRVSPDGRILKGGDRPS